MAIINMKYTRLLTIAVPCRNTSSGLRTTIEPLINIDHRIELLLVDYGSTDDTLNTALDYMHAHPGSIHVIREEDIGWGGAVMNAMQSAQGAYFMVLDPGDTINVETLKHAVARLTELEEAGTRVDMFVYDAAYTDAKGRERTMQYGNVLPRDRLFKWEDVGSFRKGQFISSINVIYLTEMLKSSGLRLPAHCDFTQCQYAYVPLHKLSTMFYIDEIMYRRTPAKSDTRMDKAARSKQVDQRILVNKQMLRQVHLSERISDQPEIYMQKYLQTYTAMTVTMIAKSGKGSVQKRSKFWEDLYALDETTAAKLKRSFLVRCANTSAVPGRMIRPVLYRVLKRRDVIV